MKLRKARKVLRLWYVGHYSRASGTRAARRLHRARECPPWFAWTFAPWLYKAPAVAVNSRSRRGEP